MRKILLVLYLFLTLRCFGYENINASYNQELLDTFKNLASSFNFVSDVGWQSKLASWEDAGVSFNPEIYLPDNCIAQAKYYSGVYLGKHSSLLRYCQRFPLNFTPSSKPSKDSSFHSLRKLWGGEVVIADKFATSNITSDLARMGIINCMQDGALRFISDTGQFEYNKKPITLYFGVSKSGIFITVKDLKTYSGSLFGDPAFATLRDYNNSKLFGFLRLCSSGWKNYCKGEARLLKVFPTIPYYNAENTQASGASWVFIQEYAPILLLHSAFVNIYFVDYE